VVGDDGQDHCGSVISFQRWKCTEKLTPTHDLNFLVRKGNFPNLDNGHLPKPRAEIAFNSKTLKLGASQVFTLSHLPNIIVEVLAIAV
jgi:hypothetical protein